MHSEMTKLRIMLSRRNYTWIDDSETWVKRTKFCYRGHSVSVICGQFSYGGRFGLLELYAPTAGIDPIGFLTAKEVIEIIREKIREDKK